MAYIPEQDPNYDPEYEADCEQASDQADFEAEEMRLLELEKEEALKDEKSWEKFSGHEK